MVGSESIDELTSGSIVLYLLQFLQALLRVKWPKDLGSSPFGFCRRKIMDSSPDKECEHKSLSSPLVAFSHLNSFCRGTRKWILIELLGDAPSSLGHGAGAHENAKPQPNYEGNSRKQQFRCLILSKGNTQTVPQQLNDSRGSR